MERSFTTVLAASESRTEPCLLHDRVLVRLIEFSFASTPESTHSFIDTFSDFAEAYFTLALEDEEPSRRPTFDAPSVDALTRVFDDAVASEQLAPVPTRLAAFVVRMHLATLQQEVAAGRLSSSEAADLCMTMLFEGMQALPHPSS